MVAGTVAALVALTGTAFQLRFSIVDIPFWDQWDFLEPFFGNGGLVEKFMRQHGPHRQGLGNLLIDAIFAVSPWNVALIAWASIAAVFLASVCFARVAVQVVPRPQILLVASVPFLILRPGIFESVTLVPNPAHGVLPLLLIGLYALAIVVQGGRYFFSAATAIAVFAVFTGFGIFLGAVHLALLVLLGSVSLVRRDRTGLWKILGSLAVLVCAFGLFFIDYRFDPASSCFVEQAPVPSHLAFLGAYTLRALSVTFASEPAMALVGLLLIVGYGVLSLALFRDVLRIRGRVRVSTSGPLLLPWVLISTGTVFGANAAIGRTCLGFMGGASSRYVPFGTLIVLGVVFLVSRLKEGRLRKILAVLILLAGLGQTVFRADDKALLRHYTAGKNSWIHCLRQGQAVVQCYENTGFEIYPRAGITIVGPKIQFLKTHGSLGPAREP